MSRPDRPRLGISRLPLLVLRAGVTLLLAACATSNPPPLPDLGRTEADSMMTPAQQQKAIAEMARKQAEAEAKATKQIEQTR